MVWQIRVQMSELLDFFPKMRGRKYAATYLRASKWSLCLLEGPKFTLFSAFPSVSKIEKLEKELNLKQLQINRLLEITQAINDNMSAEGIFNMYREFLQFAIGISRIALFFKEDRVWDCVVCAGAQVETEQAELSAVLLKYKTKQALANVSHPLLSQFDLIIPVLHKELPIAYALIGGFTQQEEEDIYNKVQIVTTITNVVAVAIENKRMFKQQLLQEMVSREVEVAAQIQRSLVPSWLPSGKNYQLSSIYRPHSAVGGDYYDVVEFSDGQIAFCIADITGKGIPAALLMANFQANFHTLITRLLTLEEIVHELNSAVWRVTQGDKFITLFIGKYDMKTRTLHYVNAGHAPPLLIMKDEVVELRNGCTSLGWMPELPFLEIGGICLTEDALVFTYTDGLTDIRNSNNEYFDDGLLTRFLLENASMDAKNLNTKLLDRVDAFRGKEDYPDDITVLTCRIFAD
jgi:phosphoserine phosphatase RsbU/P